MTEDNQNKKVKRSEETLRLDPVDAERLFQATVKLRTKKQAIMEAALRAKLAEIEGAESGTESKSVLSENPAPSHGDGILIPMPEGIKIKGAPLGTFKELASKLLEIIAIGNSDLVRIVAKGINWAYDDLRLSTSKVEPARHVAKKARIGGSKPD